MLLFFFTGIRKTDSQVSRSDRVTEESSLSRASHTCCWKRKTKMIIGLHTLWRYLTSLHSLAGFYWIVRTLLHVMRLWFTLSSRHSHTKRLKCSKRNSFVCAGSVVSSCMGSNVTLPATLMIEKMKSEMYEDNTQLPHPQLWWVMENHERLEWIS